MRVDLTPPSWAVRLLSDLTDWQREPVPVAELAPFELPDDAYFEYAWEDESGARRPDPDNPNPRLNPWWEYASNLAGPAYRPDPDADPGSARPRGRVLRLEVDSRQLGLRRRVLVYSPPGLAEAELPLVLCQDGKAYYAWGKLPQIYDRLLLRGEVAPAHLVFVPPGERTREYFYNPEYRRFLTSEVLPLVESRARCNGRRTAWGASLGGLLSAMLAWERRDLFQAVVTQSGAFLFSPDMERHDPFHGGETFLQEVRRGDPRGLRWRLDCGTLEWLLDSNRRLAAALDAAGADVVLATRNAGHNWVNWRNGIAAGLRWALPRNFG